MKRVNKKDKDNILMTKAKVKSVMHPNAEQRKELKNVTKEEFNRYVRKCGSSGHIGVSKHWVNKFVKVTMEEILD